MKTLAWQTFFNEQRELHGKVVFSVAELANVAQTNLHTVNTELGRLVARGLVCRYAHGHYGPAQGVSPENLVGAVDTGAYITGFYALFRRHLVTQAPSEVTCFTNRRHHRKPDRSTPAGRLRFVCPPAGIYAKPRAGVLAPPEQALCDFVWLHLRESLDPRSLVTFHNLHNLRSTRLEKVMRAYPENVRNTISELTQVT